MQAQNVRSHRKLLVVLAAALSAAGCGASRTTGEPVIRPVEPAQAIQQDRAADDDAIAEAVRTELEWDPAVASQEIEVEVENGIVTLGGTVDTLLVAQRAVLVASEVRGVVSVVSLMQVDPPTMKPDWKLEQDIRDAWAWDPVTESYELDVSVTDGVARVTGDVDSFQEAQLAIQAASSVSGVLGIESAIVITYEEARTDDEIRVDVESALLWDVLVEDGRIHVDVENGIVTLSGMVGSAAEKMRAAMDAWVVGVQGVSVADLVVADDRVAESGDESVSPLPPPTDGEIAAAMHEALLKHPRVEPGSIEIGVVDGKVALSGTVSSLKAKMDVEQIAWTTHGVDAVENGLEVTKALNDEQMEQEIEDAFARDAIVDRFEIVVTAEQGAVELRGEVDSHVEKYWAADIASRVPGVHIVVNLIDVDDLDIPVLYDPFLVETPGPTSEYVLGSIETMEPDEEVSDADLEKRVSDQIWWSPHLSLEDVEVLVSDGIVTLSGVVDSPWEKVAAANEAWQAGAIDVKNELSIE